MAAIMRRECCCPVAASGSFMTTFSITVSCRHSSNTLPIKYSSDTHLSIKTSLTHFEFLQTATLTTALSTNTPEYKHGFYHINSSQYNTAETKFDDCARLFRNSGGSNSVISSPPQRCSYVNTLHHTSHQSALTTPLKKIKDKKHTQLLSTSTSLCEFGWERDVVFS